MKLNSTMLLVAAPFLCDILWPVKDALHVSNRQQQTSLKMQITYKEIRENK